MAGESSGFKEEKAATNGPLLTAGSREFRTAEEPRTTLPVVGRVIDPAAAGEFVFSAESLGAAR